VLAVRGRFRLLTTYERVEFSVVKGKSDGDHTALWCGRGGTSGCSSAPAPEPVTATLNVTSLC
jgi:hypothetical protein